ncbi:hypothetical protein [Pseudomonas chlororaphis]|uniref:hypothetical protein n=1 Tax=Pseudomonas chlororaphis TaxID=587753 RepID=UPI001F153524|nr:hypothetical protein [Pseudomonas chlororaphis]
MAQQFSEPERLRLQLSAKVKKKPLDVGSFVYSLRRKNENAKDNRGTPVVISSFVENRRELVVRLLESFIGLRDASVLQFFSNAERFIDWADTNGYKEAFFSEMYAQQAYRDYTAYLNHQIAHSIWKPTTASQFQGGAVRLIELCFPDSYHHILSGAVKIIPDRGSASASNIHVELYRDVCLAIALQCGDFVLANKPYPCVVSIRDYEVVVFPSFHGAVGPFKVSPLSYNAAERRIATVEEYISAGVKRGSKPGVRSSVAFDLARARTYLDSSNEDNRHWHRLHVAYLAARAYTCLFLLITGATPTELAQFSYEDAQEVEKSPLKKELSAVKFRAGGKSTTYNIGRNTGLPLLKEYLKLREWILNGTTHERLFFTCPDVTQRKNFPTGFAEVSVTQAVTKFYHSIKGVFLDPNVPIISARKMRKHKSNGMHSARISPSTIAVSLNHTEVVNLSTYADATPEQQDAEFGQFWQSMRHAAHVIRERSQDHSDGAIGTAAGHCDGFNHPTPVAGVGEFVELNCRTQYGCLYCEHYICHSDEEDLHKLLSLQYVINSVRKTVPDVAHAEALYKDLSIRIEFIIEALCKRSDSTRQTVEAVKIKVFEYGEITAFWESRLSRYERLGVTF